MSNGKDKKGNTALKTKNKRSPLAPSKTSLFIGPLDFFWMGIFPFIVFAVNQILFSVALDWAMSVYADDYLHFLGGASIAFSVSYLLNILNKAGKIVINNNLIKFFVVLSAVALAAVLWELFEFVSDIITPALRQPTVADTIKDLVMGLLGGAILTMILRTPRINVNNKP